ncbi:hypothetical protein NSPZN2_30443 [Nitrospira defluvii]|uniref:Transposase n=1 Tax=Nitrospira defluvii TaxID=330214 RepID=A0ABM8RJQ2_9BACT|nr:hypothetical protein NSPZN2_30443 [Nitrospira defluvii]
MGAFHVTAGVGAGTAGGLTNLIDQHRFEAGNVGVRKLAVDAVVGGHAAHEVIHDCGDSGFTAQAVVERFLRCGCAGWCRTHAVAG